MKYLHRIKIQFLNRKKEMQQITIKKTTFVISNEEDGKKFSSKI